MKENLCIVHDYSDVTELDNHFTQKRHRRVLGVKKPLSSGFLRWHIVYGE
tara:strand:+ start:281 stop:430 length:150 start_codon:yes stop_codon:yes gene_type:complete